MQAIISGRAGVALVVHDDQLYSITLDDAQPPAPCTLRDARFLLGDALDLVFLDDADLDAVRRRLADARSGDDALQFALFLLDAALSDQTRRDAASALERLLMREPATRFVEGVLYSHPVPASADLVGGRRLADAEHAATALAMLDELTSSQTAITDVCRAWEAVPASLFAFRDPPAQVRAVFVRAGLFRELVRTRRGETTPDHFLARAEEESSVLAVSNRQAILEAWLVLCPPILPDLDRLMLAFDGVSDGALVLGASGRILRATPSVERLLGHTSSGLIWSPLSSFVHAEERAALAAGLSELSAGGGAKKVTARVQHLCGHYISTELSCAKLQHDRSWRSVLVSVHDISRYQAAAEAMAQVNVDLEQRVAERTAELTKTNTELVVASRARDQFLATMSHELRTPLNAVLSNAELLEEDVYGPLTHKQRASVRSIDESGRHLLALVNDVLDLSKIAANRMELTLERVNVGAVCRASLRLVRAAAESKQIAVSWNFEETIFTMADERRLKQVLVNLLANAVKFTPVGGSIGLDAVQINATTIQFSVWDTGIGIAAEDLGKLFQPFTQLNPRPSRQHGGTGLGLALVKQLVEFQNGSVAVESEPGKGSRFTVTLPYLAPTDIREPVETGVRAEGPRPRAEELPTESSSQGENQRKRVLVVEDDQVNTGPLIDYLQRCGYEVFEANDGQEAVEMAKKVMPAVILMDVQMPKMTGIEATRAIRADASPDARRVQIIAVTALAMKGDRERCLEAGMDDYLSKPVGLRKLIELVNKRSSLH